MFQIDKLFVVSEERFNYNRNVYHFTLDDVKGRIQMTRRAQILEDLLQMTSKENIRLNQPLKEYTYTKLGGEADYFVTPVTYEEVQRIIQYTREKEIPFTLIGNGSNLIIRDGGIRGIVMHLGKLEKITAEETKLIAQAGAKLIQASREALKNKLTRLEFDCGIPGSVGGGLYMNAGAYGGEVKDVLESALVVTREGELVRIQAEDLGLKYRYSNIQEKGYIVLEAVFQLKKGDYES